MFSIQRQHIARKRIPVLRQETRFAQTMLWIFVGWGLAYLVARIILAFYVSSLSFEESTQFMPIYKALQAWYLDPATFIVGSVIFCVLLLRLVSWKQATAGVRKADFRLCIFCKYPLTEIQKVGSCPECGKPFDIEITQGLWRAAIDTPKPTNRSL